jgi:hypothetical protein
MFSRYFTEGVAALAPQSQFLEGTRRRGREKKAAKDGNIVSNAPTRCKRTVTGAMFPIM